MSFNSERAKKGAVIGGTIGSVVPVFGTAIGAGVGGLIGGFTGGGRNAKGKELLQYQQGLSQAQLIRAAELQQELDAQGRPIMDAQVLRQQEIADLAEQYAKEGMPEAQRQMAADDIQRNQAMQLSAASNLGAGLRALGNTQASTANAYRNLAAQDAAIAQQNQAQYLGSLSNLGAAEGMAEQYNELMPYQEKQAEMQALLGSTVQNQMGALGFDYQRAAQNEQMLMDVGSTGAQLAMQIMASQAQQG